MRQRSAIEKVKEKEGGRKRRKGNCKGERRKEKGIGNEEMSRTKEEGKGKGKR